MEQIPHFSSFFMCGFECTYAMVEKKERFDLLEASMHDVYCADDYKMIQAIGVKSVREGFSWSQIDKGSNQYDFSRFVPLLQAGKTEKIQQIWDLNHFDYPTYIDPFSDSFVTQFGEYAKRCIEQIRIYQGGTVYIAPINEISFSAWIGADRGLWYPYKHGPKNGFTFKKQLVKAAIVAMDAIWQEDKNVRFIQVDPVMRKVGRDAKDKETNEIAKRYNDIVRFETWDMLSGRVCPELGGDDKYLDILGINYYLVNQEWVIRSPYSKQIYGVMIPPHHPDRVSFASILKQVYERYKRPMVITETGSHGELRPGWWETILEEVTDAIQTGIPLYGVCAYPTVDKPSALHFLWPQSGIWDFDPIDPTCRRIPSEPTLDVIRSFIDKGDYALR